MNLISRSVGHWRTGWLITSIVLVGLGLPTVSWSGVEEEAAHDASRPMGQAEAHLRLGVDFFLTHELDVAIGEFQEAVRLRPGYTEAYHNLGVALAKTGDLQGAITAWTQAERLDPQTVSLRYGIPSLVAYNYGIGLLRGGRLRSAMRQWQEALRLQPDMVEAHYALGLAYVTGGNPLPALRHFRQVMYRAPEWAPGYEGAGLAYFESHEYAKARETWQKALGLSADHAVIYANLGMVAVQEGNFRQAVEWSGKALDLQPDLAAAHFNVGMALYRMDEEESALKALQTAWRLDPALTSAPMLIGVIWSRQDQWAKAATVWRHALHETATASAKIRLHYNLGLAQNVLGNPLEALAEFRLVVSHWPEWVQGWSQMGRTLMTLRQWEQAEQAFIKAAELEPRWGHVTYALGRARLEQGRLPEAEQAFRQAVEVEPSFPEAHYQLSLVLRAQNRLSEAVKPLHRAAEGGLPEAQVLLASMYANGSGIEKDLPSAMLWWFRSSQLHFGSGGRSVAGEQLSDLRRKLHEDDMSAEEREKILAGFALIRHDLAQAVPPRPSPVAAGSEDLIGTPQAPSDAVVGWMLARGFALDEEAREILATWYEQGVEGFLLPHDPRLHAFFLQTGREGNPHSCQVIQRALNSPSGTMPAPEGAPLGVCRNTAVAGSSSHARP